MFNFLAIFMFISLHLGTNMNLIYLLTGSELSAATCLSENSLYTL